MSLRKKAERRKKAVRRTSPDLRDAVKEVLPLLKEVFVLTPVIPVLGSGQIWAVGLQVTPNGPRVSVSGTIDIATLKQLAVGTVFLLQKI